jgi:hypothetical protein
VKNPLAHIQALQAKQPQLDAAERVEYDQLCNRLRRAEGDLRRATKRQDAKKIATAERAITRAKAWRDTFVNRRVGHLPAPARIISKFEGHWSGPSGSGVHHHACEMVLDHKDISGPQYRTVRVLRDEGGPPTNARNAPYSMGVAWFALADQIERGKIVVLGEEEPS